MGWYVCARACEFFLALYIFGPINMYFVGHNRLPPTYDVLHEQETQIIHQKIIHNDSLGVHNRITNQSLTLNGITRQCTINFLINLHRSTPHNKSCDWMGIIKLRNKISHNSCQLWWRSSSSKIDGVHVQILDQELFYKQQLGPWLHRGQDIRCQRTNPRLRQGWNRGSASTEAPSN